MTNDKSYIVEFSFKPEERRAFFAGLAMPVMLGLNANLQIELAKAAGADFVFNKELISFQNLAKDAVEMADALIAELDKKKS